MAQGIFSGIPIRDYAEYKGNGVIYLEGKFTTDTLRQMISRIDHVESSKKEVSHG